MTYAFERRSARPLGMLLSVLAFLISSFAHPGRAQAPSGASTPSRGDALRQFFPFEASIFFPKGISGLFRLDLSIDVLERCQPDLSDLRIFDSSNREVPYQIAHLPLPRESYEIVQSLPGEMTGAKRNRNATVAFEAYELSVPKEVQADPAGWVLVMKTAAPRFVREVMLSNTSLAEEFLPPGKPSGSPTIRPALTPEPSLSRVAAADVVTSSVFRLPNASAERTFVPLGAKVGPTLHVLIAAKVGLFPPRLPTALGDSPGTVIELEPKFSFEKRKPSPTTPGLVVTLEESSRTVEKNKTVLVLKRPLGIVPQTLRVSTSTQAFHRKVEVFDDRKLIGQGAIFRLPTPLATPSATASATAAPAETLDITLAPSGQSWTTGQGGAPGKKSLRVEITNEDSPALDDIQISVVLRQPTLVFAMNATTESGPVGMMRLGGGRLRPPRYDLSALILDENGSGQAILALPKAVLGSIGSNDHFLAQSSLSSLMRPGIKVDARLYTKQRVLTFAPSADGLNTLFLSPIDLAAVRSDMADVRIVDDEEKQWPFLIDANAEEVWTELATKPTGTRHGQSTYDVVLPAKGITFDRLEISSATPFYERHLTVKATDDSGTEHVLFNGSFARRNEAGPTEIGLSRPRLSAMTLSVRDGENAPLEKVTVRGHSFVPALYVIAPAGTYRMLIGYPEAHPPSYDIGNDRELLAKVASAPAGAGPLVENPDFRERARLGAGEGPQHLLLWGALGLAVVVLAALTLRMVRKESDPPGSA